jgi:hypothetical protein
LSWNGGLYAGVPIVVSDAQTPGRISAVDASRVGGAQLKITQHQGNARRALSHD